MGRIKSSRNSQTKFTAKAQLKLHIDVSWAIRSFSAVLKLVESHKMFSFA